MHRFGTVLLGSLALSACASETVYKMVPTASEAGSVRWSKGYAAMVSDVPLSGAVMLFPVRYDADQEKMYMIVGAFNRSDHPVNFGTEDVTIRLDNGVVLPVQDFDYLKVEAKHKAQRDMSVAIVESGVADLFAAYVSRKNPDAGRAIYQASSRMLAERQESIEDDLCVTIAKYSHHLLQTTTIDPGSKFGGDIVADRVPIPRGSVREIEVDVRFAGQPHRFRIRIAREGTPTPVEPDSPATTQKEMVDLRHTPRTWLWNVDPPPPQIIQ